MLLESQYSQFKEDLDKPKGGTAFITDFDHKKELLAIGHGEANPQAKSENKKPTQAESKPIAIAAPPTPKEQDLPKFEDD